MFEGVPWMIGGGQAVHSSNIGRVLAHTAFGGATGITRPEDLKVVALPTPGGAVRVMPGSGPIENTYPGVNSEAYVIRNPEATDVTVPATGSTGGQVRYVIVRIDDPQYGGNASGPDGPYVYPTLVSSLSGITYPYMALARINQPANTATITGSMITDLRKIAVPRRKTELRTHAVTVGNEDDINSTTHYPDGGETWPESTENDWGFFEIPTWATRMKIVMNWSGVRSPGGDTWGQAWVQVGYSLNPDHIVTQVTSYDTSGMGTPFRLHMMVADEIPIPKALRGGEHKIYPRVNVIGGASARLRLDAGSSISLQVEFMETPD